MLCSSPIRRGVQEIGCGQCMPCRFNHRRVWTARLLLEQRLHENSYFCGFTYRDADLPADGLVSKSAMQLLLRRIRRRSSVRYFLVGEYGGKYGRPHYHAILFGLPSDIPSSGGPGIRHVRSCPCLLCASWPYGQIHVGTVTPDSCAYVAGYVEKGSLQKLSRYEFSLMSRNPGIGVPAVTTIYEAWRDGDTPGALRFGKTIMPIGRLLRGKLELLAGQVKPSKRRSATPSAPSYLQELIDVAASPELSKRREAVRTNNRESARVRYSIRRTTREKV